jgi:excisionase family DNA binding protein
VQWRNTVLVRAQSVLRPPVNGREVGWQSVALIAHDCLRTAAGLQYQKQRWITRVGAIVPLEDEELRSSEWMTVAEVADELRVTPATIRLRIRDGKLPAIRVGERGYRVRRSDLRHAIAFPRRPEAAEARDQQTESAALSTAPDDRERDLRPASRAVPPR